MTFFLFFNTTHTEFTNSNVTKSCTLKKNTVHLQNPVCYFTLAHVIHWAGMIYALTKVWSANRLAILSTLWVGFISLEKWVDRHFSLKAGFVWLSIRVCEFIWLKTMCLVIHVHDEQDYRAFLFQNSSHFCPPVWWCFFQMLQNVWDARILDSGVNYQREAV